MPRSNEEKQQKKKPACAKAMSANKKTQDTKKEEICIGVTKGEGGHPTAADPHYIFFEGNASSVYSNISSKSNVKLFSAPFIFYPAMLNKKLSPFPQPLLRAIRYVSPFTECCKHPEPQTTHAIQSVHAVHAVHATCPAAFTSHCPSFLKLVASRINNIKRGGLPNECLGRPCFNIKCPPTRSLCLLGSGLECVRLKTESGVASHAAWG